MILSHSIHLRVTTTTNNKTVKSNELNKISPQKKAKISSPRNTNIQESSRPPKKNQLVDKHLHLKNLYRHLSQ